MLSSTNNTGSGKHTFNALKKPWESGPRGGSSFGARNENASSITCLSGKYTSTPNHKASDGSADSKRAFYNTIGLCTGLPTAPDSATRNGQHSTLCSEDINAPSNSLWQAQTNPNVVSPVEVDRNASGGKLLKNQAVMLVGID